MAYEIEIGHSQPVPVNEPILGILLYSDRNEVGHTPCNGPIHASRERSWPCVARDG